MSTFGQLPPRHPAVPLPPETFAGRSSTVPPKPFHRNLETGPSFNAVPRTLMPPSAGLAAMAALSPAVANGFHQFHRQPPSVASEPGKKLDFQDLLSKTSLSGLVIVNTILLFSSLISKRADLLYQSKKNVLPASSKLLAALKMMADKPGFVKKLYRINSAVGLVQLNTNFQTAINSQQPSKLLASATYSIGSLGMILKPSVFFNIVSFLGSVFWFAGERNDIENSNHPGQRRELDVKRLFQKGLSAEERQQELGQVKRFIGDDLRYAFSLKPFKELLQGWNTDDWTKPQSYQMAFAAQCSGLTWLSTVGLLAADKLAVLKPLKAAMSTVAKSSAAVGAITAFLPLSLRAWQNRGDMESFMTLTGVPLATISRVSMASSSLSALKGLGGIGSPMVNEGKRLTSRRYRALVNQIKDWHRQAQQNPQLTAQQLLGNLQASPEEIKVLEQKLGRARANFLQALLAEAARKQQEGVSLADFLHPLTLSNAPD